MARVTVEDCLQEIPNRFALAMARCSKCWNCIRFGTFVSASMRAR